MKEMLKKNVKIFVMIILVLIVVAVASIITYKKGINYSLRYGENTTIMMYLDKTLEQSEIKKIKNIVTEIFGKNNTIQTVENLNNNILITVKSCNDEQLNKLIAIINEKYSVSLTQDSLQIDNNSNIKLYDLIYPYLSSVIICFVLILLYFIIRYKKISKFKIIASTIFTIVIVQILYFSIYAIIRVPINALTMPISMILFILSFILLIEYYDKI